MTTYVRALCCECGNLRTVSSSYRRYDAAQSRDDDRHPQGWRMTCTLKCSACKTRFATHALLRDDAEPEYRDYAEESQWLTRDQLLKMAYRITGDVHLSDLTNDELRQLLALLTVAETRKMGRR